VNSHDRSKKIRQDALRFLEIGDEMAMTPEEKLKEKIKKRKREEGEGAEEPGCVQPIKSPMYPVKIYHCWASSVLDRLWRFEWWCTAGNTRIHQHAK